MTVSLSSVALPTETVPLSAPGGPPERSALSASAMPRTPCSPIPGVGRYLSASCGSVCEWTKKYVLHLDSYMQVCVVQHMYQTGHHLRECGAGCFNAAKGCEVQCKTMSPSSHSDKCTFLFVLILISMSVTIFAGMHPPGPPLARPILPKDRGAMDRVIEYLVGDGPQNR